jgi:hypothetical protein
MNFAAPFLQNPRQLAPGRDYAPALSIYFDREASLVVTSTEIQITIGLDTVNVGYEGKTIDAVVSEICVSSPAVFANALNQSHLMTEGFLFFDGETTADGAWVVRMRAHVVKYEEETRIRALEPYPEHRLLPWHPRVDRGGVLLRRQGVDFLFAVPEYAKQPWSTYFGAPFADVTAERPQFVNQRLLRLARTPVFWYRNNITMTVDGIPFGSSIVEDVDVHNGFVRLTSPVQPQSRVLVNYTYEEKTLIYREVDLNPSRDHNPSIVDQTVLLYLKPVKSSIGELRDRGVYHVIARTIPGAISAIEVSEEPKLVIGAYQVRPLSVLEDVDVRDVRRRGGGIHDDWVTEARARNMEVASYTDVGRFDGVPFPGSGGMVLKLPRSILERLDADRIEKLVSKHIAVGGSVLLDFDEELSE